ncbi:collagen alpha-3(VI) chain [Callorhinchus milii]|uniref:collagen alpha-3(VI) chain n=1 Tax=Callorhinchus milii TaxID=7868 RepID=UPI001C3FDE63|nr:collagen alpha-3(VI) chain [Callorhinchus milii]
MFSMIANRVIVLESVEMSPEVPINRRDIVFLIDGSASLGRVNFLQIRDFILSIVEKFEVGPDAVQVGLVQYSNNAKTEFYLNTFSTKAQVLGFIRRLRLKMGRPLNTGAALDYVFKTHFTSSAGSRKDKDIPQLLVLITAGKSKDDVKMPADTLKEASIMTLAIGGRNADLAELQKIAIDPSLVFNVKEFRSLPHVLETVMTPLSALTGVTRVEKQPTPPLKDVPPPVKKGTIYLPNNWNKVHRKSGCTTKTDRRDIVFLVDGTLNFGHKNFAAIRGFVARIIGAQDIGSDRVRVGLVQYSDDAEAEFYLNTYSTKAQLLSKIKQLRPKGGRTLKTGAALDNVSRYLFTKSAGGRREEGVPQFLVHVAGGSSIDDTKQSSDALLRAGVMTLAVGVGNADQQRLSEIALDPSLGFYVKEFRSLPDIEQKVLLQLSTLTGFKVVSELPTVPSIKEMVPTRGGEVFTGTTKADRRDIVFLVDGTLNFSHKNFAAIRGFVARIIGAQDIGSDRVRVGLVQYSDDAKTEFYLKTYTTKAQLLSKMKQLRPKGGRTLKTGAALDYVSRYLFTKSAGGRREEGVPQFLVHVAGGSSIDDTKQSSDALLRTGVMALAVGVGNADQQRLSEIALDPSLVFYVKEFRSLPDIVQKVLLPLSTLTGFKVVSELPTVPSIKEMVPTSREEAFTDVMKAQGRDIVFLIDGSTKVEASFPSILKFLQSITQELNIGRNADQVGVVQYSDDPKVEFFMNTYSNKEDILTAVQRMRFMGGRALNTGKALDYVMRHIFTKPAGSRLDAGVAQMLVLLTSGKSRDDVKQAGEALKRAAIVTFVIGGMEADGHELQEIAYSSNLMFAVEDFQSLPDIKNQLLRPLKTLTVEIVKLPTTVTEGTTKADRRDIVFLVDGSLNFGHKNFASIRGFVARIIGAQDIGSDRVRVGLVQYSDDAEAEFYLNTYSTKAQLLSKIKQLRPKGGRTLKTGAALDYVSRYLFTKSAGGRREEGVPQFLVHVAGGSSIDDTKQSSDALLRAGVMTLAVGVGNADQQRLSEIASDPSLGFYVKEFQSLPDIEQKVLLPLSTLTGFKVVSELPTVPSIKEIVPTRGGEVFTGTTKADRRDIVFLVDGSLNFGHKNFASIRGFVARIIGAQDIGSDRVRIGLVQYSDDAETEFYLNTNSTKAQLLSKIKQLRPKGGRTLKTGAALDYVSRYLFTKSAGGRREEGVPQFLVHVAGDSSIDDTKQSSDALLRAGVMTLAVGVGNADQQRLSEIALDPSLGFYVKEFRSLPDIEQKVLLQLSTLTGFKVVSELPTVPSIKEMVPTRGGEVFTGTTKADRRDIVFLVDGTLNFSHKNFAAIRGFVARIIGAQDIGSDRVRVGLVQYSDDAKTEFYLKTYTTKAQLLSKMKQLRPKGGRTLKTGAALDYVSRYLFTKSAGGRREEGVPQFLVHVAGGSSIDDTKQSSDALLRTGVMALAVGVGNADQQRLSEIALDPSLVFYVKEFRSLPDIVQKVLLPLSTLTGFKVVSELPTVPSIKEMVPTSREEAFTDVMKAQGRDIVFLIDGSTKVEASFPSILKFLQSITQELNIGRNADQVGVVQYSDDPKVEFFMNTYSNKEDILTAVQRMRFMGGRALNTGKALDYVMRHIFTKPAGSRLDAGVAQMLVLLTSGKSRDDVKQAGEALKRAAIVTFVIGGMEADGHELQEIAYSPT